MNLGKEVEERTDRSAPLSRSCESAPAVAEREWSNPVHANENAVNERMCTLDHLLLPSPSPYLLPFRFREARAGNDYVLAIFGLAEELRQESLKRRSCARRTCVPSLASQPQIEHILTERRITVSTCE
jgi:hypothetical protein